MGWSGRDWKKEAELGAKRQSGLCQGIDNRNAEEEEDMKGSVKVELTDWQLYLGMINE